MYLHREMDYCFCGDGLTLLVVPKDLQVCDDHIVSVPYQTVPVFLPCLSSNNFETFWGVHVLSFESKSAIDSVLDASETLLWPLMTMCAWLSLRTASELFSRA